MSQSIASQYGEQGFKLILAGIGGQGVIFATRLLSVSAMSLGMSVIASESHGMSQRGGSVLSHLRFGGGQAPLVRRGMADVILGFDRDEAYRNLSFLSDGGTAFINTPSERELETKITNHLQTRAISLSSLPCSRMAMDLGTVAVANVILIGFAAAAGAFPFPLTAIQDALAAMGARGLELNTRALELGSAQIPSTQLVSNQETG